MRALATIFLVLVVGLPALAKDNGQWQNQPADIRQWFSKVMKPGYEEWITIAPQSCCGEGDAMGVEMDGEDELTGELFVIVVEGNGVMENGRRVRVSRQVLQTKYGNPTDRIILFVSGGKPICLIPKTGL